ncbi:Ig-like domain-containing protein [Leifsonia sp. Root112D2]|uniref:Ig-like domain-containing protein n=1 Tax=Leifsonia sp. Root112D2 TaxID=1736426 RepID=UPI000A5D97B0|nr:Ig-like domain-containing protein [Leifsonia sp. Root112D2]
MGALSSWMRGRKALASGVVLAVLAGIPVSVALLHPGYPVTDVNLNTRDVWVTNGKSLLGGRINHQIGELDAKVNGSSGHLDVLQDGGATLLTDASQGTVQVIDPAFVSLTEKITVPVGAQLAYGKDTLAILSTQGKLWVLDTSEHLKFDASTTTADAKLGTDAQVTVSKSGTVFAVSPTTKKLYTIDTPGAQAKTVAFAALTHYQLSAVGDHPVVLDTSANTLLTENGSAEKLPAKGLRIQQAGPDSDTALVATATGLLRVPLGGGDIATVPARIERGITSEKDVSAPVFLNGCDYGAWAGAQKYLYACQGGKAVAQAIDQPVQGSDLVFRVNHGVIALNNLENGNAWLVSSNMRLVNNWAQVNPDVVTKDGQTGKERPVKASFEDAVAHRTTVNKPPVAVADNFGVRPARTTVLPVLSNDTDPDGDVLTITTVDPVEARQGKLDVIDGGRAVQFTPAQTASSTVSFRYTITDGRQAFATAQVNVTLRPNTVNDAPVATRSSTATVEVGQSIRYNVLNDWIDPDGDDVYLVGASATTSDAVQFTPDGFVTFTSKTGQSGSKEVAFTVSDGRTTASGKLTVNVKPADSLDPVAVPDFATAFTGSSVVIHPLENDLSPSGGTLSLLGAKADNGTDATATADQDRSTISFEANATGAYYLTYTLAAGSHTTQGLVLVNVSDPPASKKPPIAVKDTAYVRPGEPSTVNVLDNDVSPSGRVLVVQSVAKGADADSLNVEVLANSVIRVTAPGVLARQVQLSYTISDGYATSTAGITVVPIPPLVNHQPPVAEPDAVTVRAGDVATVHVLDNDSSPDNEPFTLDSALKNTSKMGAGAEAFISKKVVRYQAPNKAGVYTVGYGITDKFNQTATATVTFTVLAASKEKDRAPQPQELTARAFAGAAVDVVIPLDGLDPDGDSVSLDGVQSAPTLGRITKTTATSLTYQAYPTSVGTDTFSYALIDTYGKSATGTVHIGIVPRPSTVKPPTAVDDRVEVKPGKVASVPVLLNDSDPNGYVISLLPRLPEVQAPLRAKVSGGNVLVTAPSTEGAFVIRYQISNGQGGSATAFIQVLVTKDATPVYPTAADHVIEIGQLAGKSSVGVDVLEGALNPSGPVGNLTVAVEGPHAGAAKVGNDGTVTVTPGAHRMAITYSLTDPASKLAGRAFIIVPPKPGSADASTAPPHIKPGLAQQVVTMNGEKTWKLSQIIDVPSGRSFSMTGAGGTSSSHGTGTSPYVNAQTLTFAAAKDYRGPAAITFRVNDGKDPGTTKDRITLLTLPITVGSPDQSDVPPTFTPPNLTIEAGEKPQTIDLRSSSFHPNPQVLSQLGYHGLTGATKDVAASLSGSQLTVSSPLGVQPGATARLRFTVTYKNFSIPGSVNVRVVSSTRPVASQKNAPQQRELKRGTAGGVTVNNAVSDSYWINPFPEKPLVILDATAVSAPKGVTVRHTASSITVEAGTAAAAGRVNIQYHVQDATKDPQRVQIGQLTVSIHDVPDQPPAPSNVKASDAQATMQISAPRSDNGKAINSYQVAWNGGSATTGTGTFTATKLSNGTRYSFKVRAHNADGWGAWSSLSASVTPYGTPSAPTNVSLKGSDQYATSLSMTWSAPSVTGGGPVQYSYSFDSGNWSTWSTAKTATRKAAVGKHSFTVRARNVGSGKVGRSAASNVWQINKTPVPKRAVTIAKGSSFVGSGCNVGCSYYKVTIAHFAKGSYTIHYYCPGPSAVSYTDTIKAGSNGSGSFNSENGSHFRCGYNTYVKVDGVTSNTMNFKP